MRSKMKYSGVRTSTPHTAAPQKTYLAKVCGLTVLNQSGGSPVETLAAYHLGHLDRVVLVPSFPAGSLCHQVPRVGAPPAQGLLVLPPHQRQSLAIFGREGLDVEEPGHGFREV